MSVICDLRDFLGPEGVRFFQLLKLFTGKYDPVLKLNEKRKGIPVHPVHLREGMQIRNWMRNHPVFKNDTAEQLDWKWINLVSWMCRHYRSTTWVKVDENDHSTFPSEGIDVIAADDEGNEKQLYYLCSGEYVWMLLDEEADDANEFTEFTPTKWKVI